MIAPKPTLRRPQPNELQWPTLLRNLQADALQTLLYQADVVGIPQGARLRLTDGRQTHLWFLLQGQVQVRINAGDAPEVVASGTPRTQQPLLPSNAIQGECVCSSAIELLRVPLESLELLSLTPEAANSVAVTPLEDRIYLDFHQAMRAGSLELPGMPEVAVRIARHVESRNASADSIARIVQMDPSITARLIQVANSPLFGGRGRIDTCRDAVMRLGQNTTRDLVTSFVLKGVFRTRAGVVKTRMHELWHHCTQVAAISHALARRLNGFDPAQALLIGLIHDIGIIPILTSAHRYPELVDNKGLLEQIIQRLRADFSALILRAWGFTEDFISAALDAENWLRNPGPQADYADLLLIAQLHAYIGMPRMLELPRISEIPAFNKLALGQLSPRMSLLVLDEAQKEIETLRHMIA